MFVTELKVSVENEDNQEIMRRWSGEKKSIEDYKCVF